MIAGVLAGVAALVLVVSFLFFKKEDMLQNGTGTELGYLPRAERTIQDNPHDGEIITPQQENASEISFRDLFQPVVRPLEPAVSYIGDVFSGETKPDDSSGADVPYVPNEPVSALSEEQIFEIIWPKDYRNALVMLQDLMVKDGFIAESRKISVMQSDDQVYAALLSIVDYAVKEGWVVPADFEKLRAGIKELEKIITAERANLRRHGKLSDGVLLPGGQRISKTPQIKQDFFSMIIDGLKYSLTVQSANAQIPGVPGWHTTPDCYKDLAPAYWVPGPNLWAFCCNCGLLCTPVGCTFIPDCGPFSVACNVPLGCLNLMCIAWPNAIWDAPWNPLGTGICGCG